MTNSIDHDLSLALERGEPDYDIVACECGHDETVENARRIGGHIACLACYEKCRDDTMRKEDIDQWEHQKM